MLQVNLDTTVTETFFDPGTSNDNVNDSGLPDYYECGPREYSISSITPAVPDVLSSGTIIIATLSPGGELTLNPTDPTETG